MTDDSANRHAEGMRQCACKAIQDPCSFNSSTGNRVAGVDDTLDSKFFETGTVFSREIAE